MSDQLQSIDVNLIYGNPDQPRKIFDADALSELAESIEHNGLIQPITVRSDGQRRYMIVAGERRYRAHVLLASQGKCKTVSCLVKTFDDAQLAINAIIENDQRVDVTLMEQARSYKRMMTAFGYSIEDLAKKLGKRVSRIEHRVKLLNLTPEIQQLVERGQLYETQAYYLADLSSNGQGKLLKAINTGQCRTVGSLKDIAAAIGAAEAQTSMFGDGDDQLAAPEPASAAEFSAARGFEAKLEQVSAMLRAGIEDNVVTAVRKVNPGRAAQIAELMAQMQKDLHRIEKQFRVAAVQEDLAA